MDTNVHHVHVSVYAWKGVLKTLRLWHRDDVAVALLGRSFRSTVL